MSKGIVDACALITYLLDRNPAAAMPNAYPIMRHGDAYVSPMVVIEITRLSVLGQLPNLPAGSLSALLRHRGFLYLPITWEEAEASARLPRHHKDPYDRMYVAHALHHQMPVLTCDTVIPQYGVQTIW